MIALAHPSAEEPASTVWFELLREGLQESESVLYVIRAMEQDAARLDPILVGKFEDVQ
ncbi:MAG: hypothetical protein N2255_02880 [Kiritimatiellae bacterium]|nr:hypothetical protein [Kiritimatiellia bacterium]